MFYSIDRIIEEVAVCIGDNEEYLLLSTDNIIGSYRVGSIIREDKNGYYISVTEEEEKRRNENFDLAESLFDE
ncbi:MAG: DUF3006 family protein [Clostridia bacterium]|nr:DUF3006 family protein [Clostridia bacterium]